MSRMQRNIVWLLAALSFSCVPLQPLLASDSASANFQISEGAFIMDMGLSASPNFQLISVGDALSLDQGQSASFSVLPIGLSVTTAVTPNSPVVIMSDGSGIHYSSGPYANRAGGTATSSSASIDNTPIIWPTQNPSNTRPNVWPGLQLDPATPSIPQQDGVGGYPEDFFDEPATGQTPSPIGTGAIIKQPKNKNQHSSLSIKPSIFYDTTTAPCPWSRRCGGSGPNSDIDHYEVQEQRVGGPQQNAWQYVTSPVTLTDQTLRSTVFIKAVDKAGNSTIIALPSPTVTREAIADLILAFGLFGGAVMFFFRR